MMSCEESTKLISESIDRKLPLMKRLGLKIHIMMCRFCGRYAVQLNFIEEVLGKYRRDITQGSSDESRLPDTARDRMKQRLRNNE